MNTYRELCLQFGQLTEKSARFRKVVLHVHSPESYDFGTRGNCDPNLNERSQYCAVGGVEKYIAELMKEDAKKQRFDLVAITDHMRAGYACKLAEAALSRTDLCILPGIELNVRLSAPFQSMRLHLLAIFPESKSIGEIERIFPAYIPDDSKRNGQEEIKVDSLVEFIRVLHEHRAFCIAAHVDNDNGVRKLFRQTGRETLAWFNDSGEITHEQDQEISKSFKEYLTQARFDGIEVRKSSDRNHYTWSTEPEPGIKHQVPVFLTFDAHSIEELASPDRLNYIKMAGVSWQGLIDAAKFPDTRIRFSDDRVPPPYIVGMEVVSPDGKGFFRDMRLGFVENLNCIIGPRGSGKSTIVEAFRYVFGYNRTLDQLDSKDLISAAKQRQERNLANSIIRVGYRVSSDEVHFLEATFDPQSDYATKVYDIDGNSLLVSDVERDGRYPLRLFGWSEIETLGREPARQRDLLDKFIQSLSGKQDRKYSIRRNMAENFKDIQRELGNLAAILQGENSEINHYREYLQAFNKLNTPEVQSLFMRLDQERTKLDFLEKLGAAVTDLKSRVESVIFWKNQPDENLGARSYLVECLDESLKVTLDNDPILSSWWKGEAQDQLALSTRQNDIAESLRKIIDSVITLLSGIEILTEQTKLNVGQLESEIRQQVSDDSHTQVLADLRDEARKRLTRVESLRVKYNEYLAKVRTLIYKREQMINELVICHKEISDLRNDKKSEIEEELNEYQTEGMVISLDFFQDGDQQDFEKFLFDFALLGKISRTYRAKKWPSIIAHRCTPCQFARSILDNDPEFLIGSLEVDGAIFSINSDDARKIIDGLLPYTRNEDADIEIIECDKIEALLGIQGIEWDDQERILRNGQSIDSASPGQRSSAMLPLIALAESVPLLIDQPEDNLDNRLVGQILVDILAKLKEKRQIIVSTHNPNIVVLGDSEQVIVLDAISDLEGRVEEPQASVDHPFIVKNVIELLEGGKEAFETRRKRYEG